MSIILTKDSSFNINNSRNILYENIELIINCSFIIENNGTKFLFGNLSPQCMHGINAIE